jgi:hypothetical protein
MNDIAELALIIGQLFGKIDKIKDNPEILAYFQERGIDLTDFMMLYGKAKYIARAFYQD